MKRLSKIKGIFYYEFNNLIRSKIIWVSFILFIFGIWEEYRYGIWGFLKGAELNVGGALPYIYNSWEPISFSMIPLFLISFIAAKSRNEIFGTSNIKPGELLLGKFFAVLAVDGTAFLINIIIPLILASAEGLSLKYSAYLMKAFVLINLVTLLSIIAISFFIGQILQRHLGDIICYLVIIALVVLSCNYRKTELTPIILYYMPQLSSSYNFFSYDKSFYYHILFWISVAALCFLLTYQAELKITYKKVSRIKLIAVLPLIILAGAAFYEEYNAMHTRYSALTVSEASLASGNRAMFDDEYANNPKTKKPFYYTYYAPADCGYYVSSYDMDINNSSDFANKCSMSVSVTIDNTKDMEFGFYGKLNITKLLVDNENAEFNRETNSFQVILPKVKNKGDRVNIYVEYEGYINTEGVLNKCKSFFVNDSAAYLASVFEWYPKLNDNKEKSYVIRMKNSKNNIYTNLEESKNGNSVILKGSDWDIFILYGNTVEKNYKGYTFVGAEEDLLTSAQCDKMIQQYTWLSDKVKNDRKDVLNFGGDGFDELLKSGCKIIICGSYVDGNIVIKNIYKNTFITTILY